MLFPLWFFQGMEKMKYITYINVTIIIAFTIALLFFIKNKEDYIYVPMLQGISGIIGGVIALIFVFQQIGIRVTAPSARYI
ncbi:oligosaccharide flippase family protein, partial [Morganella morganii]